LETAYFSILELRGLGIIKITKAVIKWKYYEGWDVLKRHFEKFEVGTYSNI